MLFIQNCAFVCQPTPFVFVLVKLKRIFPSNRCFIGCLIRISVKVLFHDNFCTEVTFGLKWLKNSIFHYDFIILESNESRFPTPFVSIRSHRTSPFCLLLWTFGTAQLEYICMHAPTDNPSNPSWHLENALMFKIRIQLTLLQSEVHATCTHQWWWWLLWWWWYVCVCVSVCVRACMRACVCVYVSGTCYPRITLWKKGNALIALNPWISNFNNWHLVQLFIQHLRNIDDKETSSQNLE